LIEMYYFRVPDEIMVCVALVELNKFTVMCHVCVALGALVELNKFTAMCHAFDNIVSFNIYVITAIIGIPGRVVMKYPPFG